MAEPFDGAVVEIQVRHLNIRRERTGVDGETMILRRDFYFARAKLLDRVIRTAMPELQLEGIATNRQAKDLMAEADAEHRPLRLGQLTHVVDRVVQRRR